uniref:Uncharacterized protein n=1 Tax=Salix viminalis TaxID=40686 RepID=A0A6N2NIQ9_SALVM
MNLSYVVELVLPVKKLSFLEINDAKRPAHGRVRSAGYAKSQLCRYQNRNREWKVGFKKGRESLMHLGMMVLGRRRDDSSNEMGNGESC